MPEASFCRISANFFIKTRAAAQLIPQKGHIESKNVSLPAYGQKSRVSLLCVPFMKNKELNKLIGFNLRTLRRATKMTQEQLAERLAVSVGMIAKWETGAKGVGKKVLLKLCAVFDVKPYVFYLDGKAPLVTSVREQRILYRVREAEQLGVHDQIEQYCDFVVGRAKQGR